jgi:ABC-type Fe3+/spermidine/putrescine transport system ATPase subunit
MSHTMEIELRNLAKNYGSAQAVRDLSFSLNKGELIALLGPSGCGKTTTLRMVAGFIKPTSGQILVRGQDITALPPHKRDSGLVFQNYALFPHMTVTENIAFGLKRRGVQPTEQRTRIAAIIDKLKLTGLESRYPRQLSGGQQQRVAVARALVINPAILLLDEPFSNLDAKLRENTGIELRRIQQELGLTSIFVTHDQHEAMSIADKIAVMHQGVIEQIGTAAEIYEQPRTRFVADFIGKANFLKAVVEDPIAGLVRLSAVQDSVIKVSGWSLPGRGAVVEVMVRPENISLQKGAQGNAIQGVVDVVSYQGASAHFIVRLAGGESLFVECNGRQAAEFKVNDAVSATIDLPSVRILT